MVVCGGLGQPLHARAARAEAGRDRLAAEAAQLREQAAARPAARKRTPRKPAADDTGAGA